MRYLELILLSVLTGGVITALVQIAIDLNHIVRLLEAAHR